MTPIILSSVSERVAPSLKASVMSLMIGLGLIGSSRELLHLLQDELATELTNQSLVGPLLFGLVAGRGGLSTLPGVLVSRFQSFSAVHRYIAHFR